MGRGAELAPLRASGFFFAYRASGTKLAGIVGASRLAEMPAAMAVNECCRSMSMVIGGAGTGRVAATNSL